MINRENLMQVIGSELHYEGNFILEVPKTLSIVSSEADAVYLMPGGGVEFVNAAQIRNYGYVPSEEYNWKLKYEEVSAQTEGMKEEIERLNDEIARLQEESMYEDYAQEYSSETVITASENGKIFPSDIIKMENDLRAYQKEFSEGDVSREVYFTRANEMMDNILEARIQQAIHAGKEEFLMISRRWIVCKGKTLSCRQRLPSLSGIITAEPLHRKTITALSAPMKHRETFSMQKSMKRKQIWKRRATIGTALFGQNHKLSENLVDSSIKKKQERITVPAFSLLYFMV